MKKLTVICTLFLISAFLLSACSSPATPSTPSSNSAGTAEKSSAPDQKEPESPAAVTEESKSAATEASGESIKIGAMGPLTGEVAVYGISATNGAKMAVDEINKAGGILGRPVEFVLLDDKHNTTEAINAYNRLVEDGVCGILGAVTSAPCLAIAPLANEDKVPMLTPSGTQISITEGRDYVFRVCYTDPYQGTVLARYASQCGKKKAALLKNTSSEYSSGIVEAFKTEAEAQGIEIVAEEAYGSADKDFRVQLTNIASAAPDVLLVPDYYETDALIVSQAREIGLDCLVLGPDGWDGVLKQIEKSSQDVLNNVVYANHYAMDADSEKIQNFIKAYREAWGDDPTAFSALSYDGIYMFKAAIEKAGKVDREAICKELKQLNFEGITGQLTFDANNNPIKDVSMIKIVDGAYVLDQVVKAEK